MDDKENSSAAKHSASYKWIENVHILFWLIKDTCWALVWRPGGVLMIAPTVGVAIYILWRSIGNRSEFLHNAAVCCWISANSTWMVGEFIGKDLRPAAVCFFLSGLLMLAVYYIFYFRADRLAEKQQAESAV